VHSTPPPKKIESTAGRDWLIVAGVILLFTVGFFLLKKPQQPPRALTQQMGDVHGAETMLPEGALEDLPGDFNGLVRAGNEFMDAGSHLAAAESYRRALAINPDSPDVRTDYGACLQAIGLPHRALEEFYYVIGENPEHPIAHFNMGIVYHSTGQSDSARHYWTVYLSLDPDGAAAEAARGYMERL